MLDLDFPIISLPCLTFNLIDTLGNMCSQLRKFSLKDYNGWLVHEFCNHPISCVPYFDFLSHKCSHTVFLISNSPCNFEEEVKQAALCCAGYWKRWKKCICPCPACSLVWEYGKVQTWCWRPENCAEVWSYQSGC